MNAKHKFIHFWHFEFYIKNVYYEEDYTSKNYETYL